ncbi:hypothetical protein [Sulfurisphaera javensis]
MNKPLLLGLAISAILLTGLVIAGEAIYGTLATISYNISSSNNNQQIQVIPINFNLGNLTAGQSGSLVGKTNVTVLTSGTYELELKEDALGDVFSQFTVTISIANYTVTLQLHENNDYKLYLPAGTYTVDVKINYTVSQNPEGKSVINAPLLLLKYKGQNNNEENS